MDVTQSASTLLKVPLNGRHFTATSSVLSQQKSPLFSKSNSQTQALSDHQNGRRFHRALVLLRAFLFRFSSPSCCSLRYFPLRNHCSQLTPPSRQDIQRIVLSATPYLLFLLFYAINPYTHLLPLASDIGRANLRNVSSWESYFFPWQLHVIVSSVHFLPLDFLAAVPYLIHYVIPILYPVFLYLIDRLELIQQFYRLLGFTMWGHVVIWLVAPTLPPWALDFLAAGQRTNASNMVESIMLAHKEGPAFARIDSFTGRPFFYGMFVGNPVPFGSFPSGHVAWPMCILLTIPVNLRSRFSIYIVWVAWATLYTGHHYVLDILGALTLVFGLARIMGYVAQAQPRCSILPV